MSHLNATYDCAIIGGGLAGLCLAIQLAQQGHSVIVFEKHKYPFHKVCGEYVSNESFDFLCRLGVPLKEWDLPQISNIGISSEKGFMLQAPLLLGGFGISRYKLDNELVTIALKHDVMVADNTKIIDVQKNNVITSKGNFEARIVAGAFGKQNPLFAKDAPVAKVDNYIGVKYHIRTNFPADRIELHNFSQGYCGISKIEDDEYCLCYLAHSALLKAHGNSIKQMEEQALMKNPFLKNIFRNSDFVWKAPVTVSNIRFEARKLVDDRLIYLGDAAGCISPLTGNGMSMACYTAYMLSSLMNDYLSGRCTYESLASKYTTQWNAYFLKRIRTGKQLQYLFGKRGLSDLALRLLSPLGKIKSRIIEATHGQPF